MFFENIIKYFIPNLFLSTFILQNFGFIQKLDDVDLKNFNDTLVNFFDYFG